jgi:hypothetical protein
MSPGKHDHSQALGDQGRRLIEGMARVRQKDGEIECCAEMGRGVPAEQPPDSPTFTPLQKVAEIDLLGTKFDLAKNGHFTLCTVGSDAYGRPMARAVGAREYLSTVDPVQAFQSLLDILGDTVQRLQTHRDARLDRAREKE